MFTDIYEEITETFARLSVCVDGGSFANMHVVNHKREHTPQENRAAWRAEKKRYEQDVGAREHKLLYKREHARRWKEQNPEAYKAKAAAQRARIAASPELLEKRRAAKRAFMARARAAARLH